jgi:hypothetical protein
MFICWPVDTGVWIVVGLVDPLMVVFVLPGVIAPELSSIQEQ